jgi:site-specific recombinase XerD
MNYDVYLYIIVLTIKCQRKCQRFMVIKFYLDKPKQKESLIFISVSFDGSRIRMSTQRRVLVKNWDSKREKMKLADPNSGEINTILNNLRNTVEKKYLRTTALKGKPDKETVRKYINEVMLPDDKEKEQDFFDLYESFIQEKENDTRIGKRTIQYYRTVVNHLKKFSKKAGVIITYQGMNEDFYNAFINYLSKDKELMNNTIAGIIKRLKVFLNYSLRSGYTKNDSFRYTFKSAEKSVKSISLSPSEVEKLERYTTESERFANVRDLFLILIYSGMRYSDLFNLKVENINFESKRIEITTIKTMDHLIIPIHNKLEHLLLRILYKGNYKLISNNKKFNEANKDCMQGS